MKNSTFVQKCLKPLISNDDIAVDMTAGNGNDTLFLARLAKKVYAFDISSTAIKNTLERTKDYDNVITILDSHANVDEYVKEKAKVFIFNLGFLPNSEEVSITTSSSSLTAITKAYDLLVDNGYLVISFYLGHRGGKDEYYLLDDYINKHNWLILEKYQEEKKFDEPITYIIKKAAV